MDWSGCCVNRQEGGCFASFQVVGARDVNPKGDHVVDVNVVKSSWVYVDVYYQFFPDSKGDVVVHGFGGGDEMLDWGMQFFWVPKVVVQDSGCEVADRFREGSPLIWAGASSESQPQVQEDELVGRQLGAALHCCFSR